MQEHDFLRAGKIDDKPFPKTEVVEPHFDDADTDIPRGREQDQSPNGATGNASGALIPEWVFVDIGFGMSGSRSLGYLDGLNASCSAARPETFDQVCRLLKAKAHMTSQVPLHLVLEAPLSTAFCNHCPCARYREKMLNATTGKYETRLWYNGAGASTLLAVGHLLRKIVFGSVSGCQVQLQRPIVLFEGFATFKGPSTAGWNPHVKDVLDLRDAVRMWNVDVALPLPEAGSIVSIADLFQLPKFEVPPLVLVGTPANLTLAPRF